MNLKIDSEIQLRRLQMSDADDIFEIIDSQRDYLGKWLPFVETTEDVGSIQKFISNVISKPEERSEFTYSIRKNNQLVGLIDIKTTDLSNKRTEIGYWLSEDFQGEGIMSRSVQRICDYAFNNLNLNRVEIKCATGNIPSKSIAKRLGFLLEGTEREGELLSNNKYTDLEVYSMLKRDF